MRKPKLAKLLFITALLSLCAVMLGWALWADGQPTSPALEWKKADGDDTAWYRVVKHIF